MFRVYAKLIMPGHQPGGQRYGECPGEDKNSGSGNARAEESGGRGQRRLRHDPVYAERLRCWRTRAREGASAERSGAAVVGLEAIRAGGARRGTGRTRGFPVRFSAAVARLGNAYYGTASPDNCMRVIVGLIVVGAQTGCRTNKMGQRASPPTTTPFPPSSE